MGLQLYALGPSHRRPSETRKSDDARGKGHFLFCLLSFSFVIKRDCGDAVCVVESNRIESREVPSSFCSVAVDVRLLLFVFLEIRRARTERKMLHRTQCNY